MVLLTYTVTLEPNTVSLQWRGGTLYVGTHFEITYFVPLGRAVDTDVQLSTTILPLPRISVADAVRVNETTIVGRIVYSAITSAERPIPVLLMTLEPPTSSDFIFPSQLVAKDSNERLNIEGK